MQEQIYNSKVQFFQSESSFGSSSVMSNSRIRDLADQLLDDTQAIFSNMKSTLVPREDVVKEHEIEHIIHRAKLLCKQTIPLNLNKLEKNHSSNSFENVYKNREKLQILITHYQKYKQAQMTYQEFYNLYGRIQPNFSKNKSDTLDSFSIQPQLVVNVVDSYQGKPIRSSARPAQLMSVRQHPRQREVYELKDEVNRLKKREKELIREKETEISKTKVESEERVSEIFKMLKNKNQNPDLFKIREEIQKNLEEEKKVTERQKQEINKLEDQLEDVKMRNKMLQEETERNRKIQLQNSRLSDAGSYLNFEIKSQQEDGRKSNNVLKLQKIIHNLNEEKNLLRAELNKERESLYRLKKNQQVNLQSEVYQNRKIIEKKNKEIFQLKKELDKYKVETIKMTGLYERTFKQLELKKADAVNNKIFENEMQIPQKILQPVENLKVNNYSIDPYKGQGLEGLTYYEILNREFKIRFRRACLKEKELLHKFNGLQIGVITEFRSPNTILIHTHLTDFGEENIHNLNVKIINSGDNVVFTDRSSYEVLKSGQQIKLPIQIQMKSYPLGATVLICDYQFYGKKEDVRILLPAHIFKMMTIKPRDGEFRSPTKEVIKGERKILKDRFALQTYFKGCKVEEGSLKCSLMHEHTETKLMLDLSEKDGCVEMVYEHRSGEKKMTEYFISTLKFLLEKEH